MKAMGNRLSIAVTAALLLATLVLGAKLNQSAGGAGYPGLVRAVEHGLRQPLAQLGGDTGRYLSLQADGD